jgi:glucosamine-phosphate N-acetyltransferase
MTATLQRNAIIRPLRGPDLENGFLSVVASFRPCELSFESAAAILRERIRRGILTYVAEMDGRIVGTASLLLDVKFINNGGIAAIIEDVIVHPAFRGFGIGSQLVETVTQAAQELGCYKACLYCSDDLVPYYERLGFQPSDDLMRRDLSPA